MRRTPTQRRSDWGRSWWLAAIAGLVMAGFAAADPLTITITSLPDATAGVPYSQTLSATGGTAPYTWAGTTFPYPDIGLTVDASGTLSGTPVSTLPSYMHGYVELQVTDATGLKAWASPRLVIGVGPLWVNGATLPSGYTGFSYDADFRSAPFGPVGGTPPYTWAATGLPTGLTLPATDGFLSGRVPVAGTYHFSVTFADSASPPAQMTAQYQLTIIPTEIFLFYPACAATLVVGVAPNCGLYVLGGSGVNNFTITSGSLPPGIALGASSGLFSGTPTTSGIYTFTITDTDTAGNTTYDTFTFTVTGATVSISPTTLPKGLQNSSYSQSLTATGGVAPYAWSLATGSLPAGLTLNAGTGVLAGTPSGNGVFDFSIQAKDANGSLGLLSYHFLIAATPPTIAFAALPQATTGATYDFVLTAAGGSPPYSWSVSQPGQGASCSLVVLLGSFNMLQGSCAAPGTYNITLTVQDSSPVPTPASITLPLTVVAGPLAFTDLTPSTVNTDVSATVNYAYWVRGGTGTFAWSISAGALPPGVTLDASKGTLGGSPTTAGVYNFTVLVADSAGSTLSSSMKMTVAPPLTLQPNSLKPMMVGQPYSQTFAPGGGQGPSTYALSCATPQNPLSWYGLSVNSTFTLTGTPTFGSGMPAPGTYPVTCTLSDSAASVSRSYSLLLMAPFVITTTSLPAGAPGVAYPSTKLTGSGGNPPYAWTATGLPPGLTLASDGTLSGTPTVSGAYPVILTITDSVADGYSASKTISISVTAALAVATTALPPAMVGKPYSQTLSAVNGVAPYTWTLATGPLPAGVVLNASSGVISGTPTTVGTYPLGFHVTDTAGATATVALTLVVAPAGATRQGVFAQVASGGGWTTSLYLVNQTSVAVPATVNFWADPGTPLTLPLTVTQAGTAQIQSGSTVAVTIGANSTVLLECASSSETLTGWAEVVSAASVGGYGVFHYLSPAGVPSEGTVPLETNDRPDFLLPYEAKNGFGMGLAVANLDDSQAAQVTVSSWGQNGTGQIGASFDLLAGGHKSLMLSDLVPATTGDRGLLQFTSSGNIAGLGIRVNPAGGFASTKALGTPAAGAAASTGVFAQVAAGGGWTTSLYLMNPSAAPATVALSFWGDNGAALALPLTVTDADGARSITAASLNENIGPNSMVLIECGPATGAAETGWAQVALGANSQVVGYGVFHYTSPAGVESEGTVPMETAGGSTFALPYEAENQFDMGVALANLSPSVSTTVTVTLVDENGVTLTGSNVPLPAGGHTSFMLSGQIPAAAHNRGWLQFTAPAGISITGLGLRANPAGGFASVPKL